MSNVKMNPVVKALWCDALESGKYQRGKKALRTFRGHCCLGVLAELAVQAGVIQAYIPNFADVTDEVRAWSGHNRMATIKIDGVSNVPEGHNDNGVSFAAIARAIREQW